MPGRRHRHPEPGRAGLGETTEEDRRRRRPGRSADRARSPGRRPCSGVRRTTVAAELLVRHAETVGDLAARVRVVDDQRRLRSEVAEDERGERRALDVVGRRRPDEVDPGRAAAARRSRAPSRGLVSAWSVAAGLHWRRPAALVTGISFDATPDHQGPTSATVFGSATIAVTFRTPAAGSWATCVAAPSSRTSSASWLPPIPPAALTSSIASWTAFRTGVAAECRASRSTACRARSSRVPAGGPAAAASWYRRRPRRRRRRRRRVPPASERRRRIARVGRRRPRPGVRRSGTTAKTATGSVTPLSFWRPRGAKMTGRTVWVSARTVSLTRTSPGPASAQIRAAMLTAEPT